MEWWWVTECAALEGMVWGPWDRRKSHRASKAHVSELNVPKAHMWHHMEVCVMCLLWTYLHEVRLAVASCFNCRRKVLWKILGLLFHMYQMEVNSIPLIRTEKLHLKLCW